jgi:hypothetical protein
MYNKGMVIKKSNLLILLILFLSIGKANGQYSIKGKVVDAESFQPLPFATVFINNSTFGDITNQNGDFLIDIPAGTYELVISFMGYQAFKFPFSTQELRDSYEFRILQETIDLKEAEVEEIRDDLWHKNLEIFQEKFLGSTSNGKKCKILNPKVLVLDGETDETKLFARGRDVLEIENPNLGYTIKYVLEEFFHDFESNVTVFAGYPYFIEQDLPRRRKNKVQEQRKLAFEGSITHFIRTLYYDQLKEEGFVVNKIDRKPNPYRPSDEEIEATKLLLAETRAWLRRDSLQQVIKKENLPKEMIDISKDSLTREDLVKEARNGFLFLTYEDPFFVIFEKEAEEHNYRKQLLNQQRSNSSKDRIFSNQINALPVQITKFTLTGNALRLFEDGSYFHPYDLYLDGYMAWEKIGDLMPFNYKPSD